MDAAAGGVGARAGGLEAPEAPLAERTRLEIELLEARKAVEHYRTLLEGQKEKVEI